MNFRMPQFVQHKNLHPEVLSMLAQLQEMYGERLRFISSDTRWIHFTVQGLPNELVARQLNARTDLFGYTSKFQVLCPSDPSARGLYLQYLATPALQLEYKAGVYYV